MASLTVSLILALLSVPVDGEEVQKYNVHLRSTLMKAIQDRDNLLVSKSGPRFLILGITSKCMVYFGWLNQIVSGDAYGNYTFKERTIKEHMDCKDYLPVYLKTENTNRDLYLGIKRSGRRILIQSLFGETRFGPRKGAGAGHGQSEQKGNSTQTSNNTSHLTNTKNETDSVTSDATEASKLLWSSIDPSKRHFQFLSNEFEKGYVFRGAFTHRGRIILYGYDHNNVLLHELKVTQTYKDEKSGLGNLLIPTVKLFANVSREVITPGNVHVQMRVEHEYKRVSRSAGPMDAGTLIFGKYPRDGSRMLLGPVEIPLWSILRGKNFGLNYDVTAEAVEYHYKDDESEIIVRQSDDIRSKIGNFIVIRKHVTNQITHLPEVRYLLRGYTGRVWMNPFRFNRRMTYPNTIHRMTKHYILSGWKRFAPVLAGNVLVYILLMFTVGKAMKYHRRMMAKLGAYSTSHTSVTL